MTAAPTIEHLQRELAAARAERDEARAQQTATAEVLGIINASPGNLAPVFEAILEKARTLCSAAYGDLWTYDGKMLHLAASQGAPGFADWLRAQGPVPVWPNSPTELLMKGADHVQYADPIRDGHYDAVPEFLAQVELAGVRSTLFVPLWQDRTLVGVVIVYRREVRPFTREQVGVLQNFAAQAVIAMENARLINETREALEQQTATAEVLEVINASPGALAPVFGAMLDKAMHLCEAAFGMCGRFDGKVVEFVADRGVPPGLVESARQIQSPPPNSGLGRLAAGESVVQLVDLAATDVYRAGFVGARALVDIGGAKTAIFVALRKDGVLLGVIVMYRREVRAFSDKQVALLQNFAAQAVIAMDNARLLNETREALEQQTATADILRVISQSPTDMQPVLDAVAKASVRFCGALDSVIILRDGDHWKSVAHEGPLPAPDGGVRVLHRDTAPGRAMVDRTTVHYPDIAALDPVEHQRERANGASMDFNSAVAVPMLRDGESIGAIGLRKREAGPFLPRQIELLESFAAQAVIAIENVRLLTELRESLDQQTASAGVLSVISQSPTDVTPVLKAVAAAGARLCDGADTVVMLREGNNWFAAAHDGPLQSPSIQLRRELTRGSAPGRAMLDRGTVHVEDTQALDPAEFGTEREISARLNFRATVVVPMLRDGESVGAISLRKGEAGAFSPRHVALLQTFAAQAVIAIENVRLFTELKESLDQQTATSDILRVISQSPTDVAPVLEAVAKATLRFCGAEDVAIDLREGEIWRCVAHAGILKSPVGMTNPIGRKDLPGRTMIDRRVTEIPDVAATTDEETAFDREVARQVGFRAALSAPMLGKNEALGALIVHRTTPGAFSARQIALLESFAAQAVVAIENVRLFTELKESLDQQTATADILRVISQSPTDVAPVLEAVAKAARRFCSAEDVVISLRQGEHWLIASHEGPMPASTGTLHPLNRQTSPAWAILDARTIHLPDITALDPVEYAAAHDFSRRQGFKAAVAAPMLREGHAVGAVALRRTEPGAFTPRQITLLEAFAAQAVIAIANVRLFTELKESLDQQTATAEILRVISESPTDVKPVLKAVASAARRFCGAPDATIILRDGDALVMAEHEGSLGQFRGERIPLDSTSSSGRAVLERRTFHYPDIELLDPVEHRTAIDMSRRTKVRAVLSAPMLRENEAVGVILLRNPVPGPFSPRQIELAETFAAQAVIALENTRLFTELKESLDYQTATSELLDVISRSASDIQPVFDTMLASAARLCGVEKGDVAILQGNVYRHVAFIGCDPDELAWLRSRETVPGRGTSTARALLERRTDHLLDQSRDPERVAPKEATRERTTLAVPLLRNGEPLGVISLLRDHVEPFSDRQITLIETFADQAVIAMENARLLTELTKRTDELTQSLEYQTATSEVLEVISRSTTDLQPVLEAMTAAAVRLCGVKTGGLSVRRGDTLQFVALVGQTPEFERWQLAGPLPIKRGILIADAVLDKTPVQVVDVMETEAYKAGAEVERAVVELGGHRTILHVPLLRDDEAVGVLTVSRSEPLAFTERQIGLIETFADQAVIAMENARLLGELREALDQQTATAEILQVINTSPGDLMPVFRAILEKAHSSCGADMGSLFSWDGTHLRAAVTMGYSAEIDEILRTPQAPPPWVGDLVSGRLRFHHRTFERERTQEEAQPFGPRFAAGSGIRTNLIIPLRKDDTVLGFISANRRDVRPYSDKEISLLENFAAQAVIAMENARLLNEVRQRETELAVTFEHMGDGVAMFDAGLKLASWNRHFQELLDIPDSFLAGRPGLEDYVRLLVQRGEVGHDNPEEEIAQFRERASEAWSAERTRPDGRILEVRNNPVPGGGAVLIYSDITERKKAEAEIAAARDAAEAALERQTATGDILKVIASSPTDVGPVMTAVARAALRFCGATDSLVHLREGDKARLTAHEGAIDVGSIGMLLPLTRDHAVGRAITDAAACHIPDYDALDPADWPTARTLSRNHGHKAALAVPMLREGAAVGSIMLRKLTAEPFTPRQIELLETFAAQAVIAVENVRLFTELRDSLERQTATGDILKVIASSPSDTQPAFDAIAESANRLLDGLTTAVWRLDGEFAHLAAFTSVDEDADQALRALSPLRVSDFPALDLLRAGKPVQQVDLNSMPRLRDVAIKRGFRSQLLVPLMAQGVATGFFSVTRATEGHFSDEDVQLLQTFADQAVIAIENARLFNDLHDSLARLKAAQANLVQSEKMASLGQLTAGIAHEIKNPLNFVNNFATLSVDLLDELKEMAGPAFDGLGTETRAEIDETMELLTGNLGKIAEHGKRADGIVKSMLSHSRGGAGDWAPADLNALVEEALNLAYHGARSQDKEFNVTLERDLGKTEAPIEVVPQDVTRVFLNLFGNGFYAANKRRMAAKDPGFRPTLKVSTRDLGDTVEIRVRDNGIGMSAEVKEKLFQPFFTTKPTGEGTGLGLSISYDIVTQQHAGTIEVESEPNNYTEFTIRLPRARRVAEAARGS